MDPEICPPEPCATPGPAQDPTDSVREAVTGTKHDITGASCRLSARMRLESRFLPPLTRRLTCV